MLIIGHRGAAGYAPENTLQSIEEALKRGAEAVEFDVHLTKDHIPVLIHDATLRRIHAIKKNVREFSLEDLQKITVHQPIPTLAQVLNIYWGKILLNIELKGSGTGRAVTKLLNDGYIQQELDWENCFLSSFKPKELRHARHESSHVQLAMLHNRNPFVFIAYHRRLHFSALGFHRLYTQPLATEIAKRLGLFVYVYTVNRPHAALLHARAGVDGIVTDFPDKFSSVSNT
ncbi:glycerophosphodiester phosphodiesterase [Candidatus Saccharibacteria bacterium]|nr:glycerophosphodiester phosphodiesterase [Candidatus Saccharibacteria bacterium]